MSDCKDFQSSILYLCTVGSKMASSLNRSTIPYWCRCLEQFHSLLIRQIVDNYEPNKTPDSQRFLKLKEKFLDLYECFQDDFSHPFIYKTESGEKIVNDLWIRIPGEAPTVEDQLEPQMENEETSSLKISEGVRNLYGKKENRGIKITLARKGQTEESEELDLEIPLSEMFQTALFLKNCGLNRPHFIFCILYGVYKCLSYVIREENLVIMREIENFYPFSKLVENSIEQRMEDASKKIGNLMRENGDIFEGFTDSVISKISEISDENMEEMSEMASSKMRDMNKSKGSFMSLFKEFAVGSDTGDEDSPASGLLNKTDDELSALVQRLAGGKNAPKLSEIMKSIPKKGSDATLEDMFLNKGEK